MLVLRSEIGYGMVNPAAFDYSLYGIWKRLESHYNADLGIHVHYDECYY